MNLEANAQVQTRERWPESSWAARQVDGQGPGGKCATNGPGFHLTNKQRISRRVLRRNRPRVGATEGQQGLGLAILPRSSSCMGGQTGDRKPAARGRPVFFFFASHSHRPGISPLRRLASMYEARKKAPGRILVIGRQCVARGSSFHRNLLLPAMKTLKCETAGKRGPGK